MTYEELRKTYKNFIYKNFKINYLENGIEILYEFEIENLSSFEPKWFIPIEYSEENINKDYLESLAFSLGMAELISYWKLTCSPNIEINAGSITEDQIDWWKKQYFYGLGEFFYLNKIETDINCFNIKSSGKKYNINSSEKEKLVGALIPVGGGKDSIVTLDLLKEDINENTCYIINKRGATESTVEKAGYSNSKTISVQRKLDSKMFELNKKGFLNGHTPFSVIVAFSSILVSYLNKNKYVILSNESSANEPTIVGTKINHQYSKTFDFEKDFNQYLENHLNLGIKYFSILRPLNESQIGYLFSNLKEFHKLFKSCNTGSNEDKWCCKCPKCLFVFIILSPFLSLKDLSEIFGNNLFEDLNLLTELEKLTGISEEKPFECVGSIEEVNLSLCKTIKNLEEKSKELPTLLNIYIKSIQYSKYSNVQNDLLKNYNNENLLPKKYEDIVKGRISHEK